jgi:hypothetical protein
MLPQRFQESSCLKCHHEVTELAGHPEWGDTAPKLHRGFELIERYGCFGCHEIHGFDGDDRIGPDLRVEPNYWAVALQILNDPARAASMRHKCMLPVGAPPGSPAGPPRARQQCRVDEEGLSR